jgi:hypothetical protein
VVRKLFVPFAVLAAISAPATAADPAPVRLAIKPLLCVIDKAASSCMMTFDIRWKSALANEYCINDSARESPVHCWASALAGAHTLTREVSEEFVYWLSAPDGADHLAEVKITVLRVGSTDRRRERRTRHVWDVL